ncbi:MAG: SGNH/GDSL hydrolase family protein [Acidobacteriaceae bacterium]|nr:SGNH/GDSL hydrolase family protein [Acidobacteriaceae bacterium]
MLQRFAFFVTAVLLLTSPRLALAQRWTATWGSAQMRASNSDLPKQTFDGATLRQVVHTSLGGTSVRVRVSNAFGDRPLAIRSVHLAVAQRISAGIVEPELQHEVRFAGHGGVTIPVGADYVSDAVSILLPAQSDMAITFEIAQAPGGITAHPGSRATSYIVAGQHALDRVLASAEAVSHWYFLSAVDVQCAPSSAAIVALGDSITDGHGAKDDANERWTDVLARRLGGSKLSVVNRGIGGGRVLNDGLGPNALSRFDRDVLATPGARYLIVLEGVNDLGTLDRTEAHSSQIHAALVFQLEDAYVQIVRRAHDNGITVIGATVMPYMGSDYYHPSAQSEADRQALNTWIRTSGTFDSVIDFDAVARDSVHQDRLGKEFDSGDHLHPSGEGYKRMGEFISIALFKLH